MVQYVLIPEQPILMLQRAGKSILSCTYLLAEFFPQSLRYVPNLEHVVSAHQPPSSSFWQTLYRIKTCFILFTYCELDILSSFLVSIFFKKLTLYITCISCMYVCTCIVGGISLDKFKNSFVGDGVGLRNAENHN